MSCLIDEMERKGGDDGWMYQLSEHASEQAMSEVLWGVAFSVMGMYLRMYGKRRLTLLAGGCGNGCGGIFWTCILVALYWARLSE